MPRTILRPYYLSFRNHMRLRRSTQGSKRDLLMLLVTLMVMACIFMGFTMILKSLGSDPLINRIIPQKIVELLFYAFFVLLMISNTVAAIGNIYNAENMNLLLTTPVSSFRLYFAKLLECLVETSFMFVVFLLPVACSYMYCLDVKPGFFLCSALLTVPFLLIPPGIAIVVATVFVKFSSLVWKRGFFLFLCLSGIAIWAFVNLLSLLNQVQLKQGGANALVQLIGLFDNPNPIWLPSRWTADLVSYFVIGSVEEAGLKIALLLVSAFGSIALGYLTFDYFVLPVRSVAMMHSRNEEEEAKGKKAGPDFVRRLLEGLYLRLPIEQQTRAIMLKDMTSLVRDRAQSLQLLMYLGIAVVYLVVIKFMSAAAHLAPMGTKAWWAFLTSINILFCGFITCALMTRLVYPSISLEGKAFWILRTGPMHLSKLISSKFWCWLPLVQIIAVSLLLAGVIAIKAVPSLIAITVFVGITLSAGCTALAIGVGATFASFRWESPNQISSGFGTLVLLLSSLSLVLLTSAPAAGMAYLAVVPATRAKFGPQVWPWAIAACAVGTVLINTLVGMYACKKGVASLASRDTVSQT